MALGALAYDALTHYARPTRIAKAASESRTLEKLREHRRKLDAWRAARIIRTPFIEKSQRVNDQGPMHSITIDPDPNLG